MFLKKADLNPIDFEGLKIYDYTADRDESSSFAVITVPPGAVHGLSWSKRSDKYYYAVKGELQFTLEDDDKKLVTRTFAEGDFLIVHQGKRFDYCNNTQETAEIILVHTPGFDIESEVFL